MGVVLRADPSRIKLSLAWNRQFSYRDNGMRCGMTPHTPTYTETACNNIAICFPAFELSCLRRIFRSLAEASMEALERENNAKEALGMNGAAEEPAEDEDGEEGITADRTPCQGHASLNSTCGGSTTGGVGNGSGGGGCGDKEETAQMNGRTAALKRSLERKVGLGWFFVRPNVLLCVCFVLLVLFREERACWYRLVVVVANGMPFPVLWSQSGLPFLEPRDTTVAAATCSSLPSRHRVPSTRATVPERESLPPRRAFCFSDHLQYIRDLSEPVAATAAMYRSIVYPFVASDFVVRSDWV